MAERSYDAIYSAAELYKWAFSYRDIGAEVDFIFAADAAYSTRGARPRSALEFACGPGYHLLDIARRRLRGIGVDLSQPMLDIVAHEAQRLGLDVAVRRGDMREEVISPPADLALLMLSSLHHLHSEEDVAAHLGAAGRSLTQGSIYVMECIHPDDFSSPEGQETRWEVMGPGGVLHAHWRVVRPLGGDRYETELSLTAPDAETVSDRSTLRRYTREGLEALIASEGSFEVAAVLGDLDLAVPFAAPESWRMVLVLRRRS